MRDARPVSAAFRPIFRPIMAALAVLALAACGGGSAEEERPLPEGFTALADDARIAVPDQPEARCNAPSTRIVFRTLVEWQSFWEGGRLGCEAPALPADLDFTREMVALAAMGRRDASEDRISIDGMRVSGDTTELLVRRTTMQDGCAGTRARLYPRSAVRVPQGPHVRFAEEQRKLPC